MLKRPVSQSPVAASRVLQNVPFLYLKSAVPAADEVDTAGEETGLKESQNRTTHSQDSPVLDEAHSNCDSTPRQRNGTKPPSRTHPPKHKIAWKLEDDVLCS